MDKSAILKQLVSALTTQLEDLQRQALLLRRENERPGDFADQALRIIEDNAAHSARQQLSKLAGDIALLEALDISPATRGRIGALVQGQYISGGPPHTFFIVPFQLQVPIDKGLNVSLITPHSPLAMALMNKKRLETVSVQTILGSKKFRIISVE